MPSNLEALKFVRGSGEFAVIGDQMALQILIGLFFP
jgi:hypothetical protein